MKGEEIMNEKCLVSDVIAIVDDFAPPFLAMEGDAIGLQLGNVDNEVRKIWVALDPSPKVLEAAADAAIDLLVTHHALIYRPLKRIDTKTAKGASIARALSKGISVYVAHTNLDIAEGGVNDVIAKLLGLNDVEVLDKTYEDSLKKLVVFTPESHHQAVLTAVSEAGAGHIGSYSHCTFSTPGTGTFKPLEGTSPYLGSVGEFTQVNELRLETVVYQSRLTKVLEVMQKAHPYEEVAYDVYPLHIPGKTYGIGRVGNLSAPLSLREFAVRVKNALGLQGIRYAGDPDLQVQRVSVLGGSGRDWVPHSIAKGAQVLVTSDCHHHDVAEAWQDGLAMIDATH